MFKSPKLGRKSVFTENEEKELASHAIKVSKIWDNFS